LKRHFGKGWMQKTLDISDAADVEALLQGMNIHESSLLI